MDLFINLSLAQDPPQTYPITEVLEQTHGYDYKAEGGHKKVSGWNVGWKNREDVFWLHRTRNQGWWWFQGILLNNSHFDEYFSIGLKAPPSSTTYQDRIKQYEK